MPTAQRKAPLVLGLTGPIGSGVTTISHILGSKGFRRVRLSDPIKVVFREKEGLPTDADLTSVADWRKKMQDIGDEGRDESRGGHLCHWLDKVTEGLLDGDGPNVVIEGIRNVGEVRGLRDRCPRFFLIAVMASRPIRWERTRVGYQHKEDLFERDDKRDSEDKDDLPHGQQVERCVGEAEYVLINEDSLTPEDRRNQVLWDSLSGPIELMQGTKTAIPKEEEVHMAQAYALSHRSRCLKRHVGAVIVDKDGLPLSSGFNENPLKMKPCVLEFQNSCFKDNVMHADLERLVDFFCPICGIKIPQVRKPWRCPKCGEDLKRRFFPCIGSA